MYKLKNTMHKLTQEVACNMEASTPVFMLEHLFLQVMECDSNFPPKWFSCLCYYFGKYSI